MISDDVGLPPSSGLPHDAQPEELELLMEAVGPVVRVKLYRDAEGNAKGDALVTYQKDAAVLGAIQLLNGRELRPGQRAGQRWPVDISRPVWTGGAVGAPADRQAGAGAAFRDRSCGTAGCGAQGRRSCPHHAGRMSATAAGPPLSPSLAGPHWLGRLT